MKLNKVEKVEKVDKKKAPLKKVRIKNFWYDLLVFAGTVFVACT